MTLGRNAQAANLLLTAEALAELGVDVVPIERGGDVTYHGPGQLIVYPIVKLPRFREVVPFVSALERAAIATLAGFGISAGTRKEHRGVYAGDRAIAAIGIAVRQMTSLHGMSLNVDLPLDYDRLITPCGTPQFGITSMAAELGRPLALAEVQPVLLAALAAEFDIAFRPDSQRQAGVA